MYRRQGWMSVTLDEAANHEYAHAYSCNSGLKVLKVYRYFQLSGVGYLVMEFIDGIS